MMGLGVLFLAISPKLRGDVTGVIGSGVMFMDMNAPYSYIVGVLLVIAVVIYSFRQGARPR
jgi:ABC-type xylose transport system permease subunit